MNKERIIQSISRGCWAVAINRARNHQQALDFMQEALIAALEVIPRYSDKDEDELIRILARCAINRITQTQRREIVKSKYIGVVADDSYFPSAESFEEEFIYNDFTRVLRSRLNSLQQRILDERIQPSKTTLRIYERDMDEKERRKADGKLVMNLNSGYINDTHISQSLNISKATMSRNVAEIKKKAVELFEDQGERQSRKFA